MRCGSLECLYKDMCEQCSRLRVCKVCLNSENCKYKEDD